MKEEKNDVQAVERVETAQQQSVKDSKEEEFREETEKIKLKYSAKVNVLIKDKDLREKLHELLSEAVNEAVMLGQIKGVPEDMVKSITDTFADAFKGFGCLSSAYQAETYKKLFHNQRIITAHLMSAAQLLQLQIGDTESLVLPNPLPLFGTMEKTFAPNPSNEKAV